MTLTLPFDSGVFFTSQAMVSWASVASSMSVSLSGPARGCLEHRGRCALRRTRIEGRLGRVLDRELAELRSFAACDLRDDMQSEVDTRRHTTAGVAIAIDLRRRRSAAPAKPRTSIRRILPTATIRRSPYAAVELATSCRHNLTDCPLHSAA